MDKIVQGNTSNIVFLKSTDDSMIETLSKMSGTRHRTYIDTKTITQDTKALLKMARNEGKVSYTMTTKEEPVISYNSMAFIAERNSIVFRAGDAPIWNRNETILPMSWRLFSNTITQPGKDYTLQTIPTLSTAMDFDVRKNQPNFQAMLEKRMQQANVAERAKQTYQEAYGYSDYEIERLDPDSYSDDIMDLIYSTLNPDEVKKAVEDGINSGKASLDPEMYKEILDYVYGNTGKDNPNFTENTIGKDFDLKTAEENREQAEATMQVEHEQAIAAVKRYAKGTISRDMLVSNLGVNHSLDTAIINVYQRIKDKMDHDEHFVVRMDSLCGAADGHVYIKLGSKSEIKSQTEEINAYINGKQTRVYADVELDEADQTVVMSYEVTDDFLRYLTTFEKAWPFADGAFEEEMYHEMQGTDMV